MRNMKKFLAIIFAIAFSSVLFMLGSSVMATDAGTIAPSLDIVKKNLSLEDNIYILYAVPVQSGGETVSLQVWNEEAYSKGLAPTVLSGTVRTIEGQDCWVFSYNKVSAKRMTENVYAQAFAEIDGKTVYGNILKYNILQYAYNKKDSSNTTLVALLDGMLNYGALAQLHFNHNIDRLANADYYEVTLIGGTLLSDGFTAGLYKTGESVTITALETDGDIPFAHWQDANGNIMSEEREYIFTVGTESVTYTAFYAHCVHNEVIDPAVAPTCTETGLTEGSHCSLCEEVLIEQTVVPATGHTEEVIPAVAPTCQNTGLSEGKRCSICKEVLVEQTLVPTEHTFVNGRCSLCGTVNLTYVKSGDTYRVSKCGTDVTGAVVIPSTYQGFPVTEISASAFFGCNKITSVVIPDSVTYIGLAAFKNCTALQSMTLPFTGISETATGAEARFEYIFGYNEDQDYGYYLPTTLKTVILTKTSVIPNAAFIDLANITSIQLPNTVTSIGTRAFYGCSNLTSLELPSNITNIGSEAFYGCSGLTKITIPEKVTTIYQYTFNYCTSLTSITIPKNVTSISEQAFQYCSGLTTITVTSGNTTYHSVGNCLIETATKTLVLGCKNSVIPTDGSVTEIGRCAFEGCTGLTSITIPKQIRSIGFAAFKNCDGLTSVVIPYGVQTLYNDVFAYCDNLESITLPSSLVAFGTNGSYFNLCGKLTSITFEGTTAHWETIANTLWNSGLSTDYTIYCIDGTIDKNGTVTPSAYPWSENLAYTSNGDGTCYVSGIGTCTDTVINIPEKSPDGDKVTAIGSEAFMNNTKITSVSIPYGVKRIESKAFYCCTSLKSVTLPSGLSVIGTSAFSCSGLTSVTIPYGLTMLETNAFMSCKSLTSVEILSSSLYNIGSSAFSGCSKLTSVTIAEGLKQIHIQAFASCTALTTVTIPSTVTTLQTSAFSACTALSSITILNKDCTIGDAAYTIPTNATIYGYTGSTAEAYATTYSRTFVAIS